MLERKRARANPKSGGEEKGCAPRATWTETQSKGAESAGEGGRTEGQIGSLRLADAHYYILYIEQINNKVLLGTGNYIQYPVISHNGEQHEKQHIYV